MSPRFIPKKPCPICDAPITTMKMARQAHLRSCAKIHGVAMPNEDNEPNTVPETAEPTAPQTEKTPPVEPVAKQPEPASVAPVTETPEPTPAPQVEKPRVQKVSNDPKVQRDYERALANRESRRKRAPDILANPVQHTDALVERENHLKAEGLIPDDMHCFWGDKTKHNQYIGEGYIPAIEKGELQDHGENRLYYIDEAVHWAEEKRAGAESRARIEGLNKEAGDTLQGEGETLSDDSMKVSRDDARAAAARAREAHEAQMLERINKT